MVTRWVSFGPLIMIALVLGLATSPASAQEDVGALKAEVERLKAEVEGLKSELRLIRDVILQRLAQPSPPAAPSRVVARVSVTDNPTLGKEDAAVTLVEFSDYQCPFCRRFFDNTLPALKKEYIESGKMRYVFRDFPMDAIHPQARKAAEAAHCAGEQGKYWEMHDTLFRNQQALQVDHLRTYAGSLQLDAKAFGECVEKGTYASKVQKNYDEGATAGVRGTPGFFVGKTRKDGTIEGLLISGARERLPPGDRAPPGREVTGDPPLQARRLVAFQRIAANRKATVGAGPSNEHS